MFHSLQSRRVILRLMRDGLATCMTSSVLVGSIGLFASSVSNKAVQMDSQFIVVNGWVLLRSDLTS